MIEAIVNSDYTARLNGAPSGLVGTLTFKVINPDDASVVTPETTAGITETVVGGGLSNYRKVATAPADDGVFAVTWTNPTPDPDVIVEEELRVKQPGALVPTPEEVRDPDSVAYSELLSSRFADPDGNVAMETWLGVAARLVASLTCRQIGDATGESMEPVPADLVPLATRVIVWRTEVLVQRGSTSASRRKGIASGNLQSISAGPWSETYFGPESAMKAMKLDPDPDLAELLWALATPECRSAWVLLWTGRQQPGAAIISFDYGNRPGGYGAPGVPGSEFLPRV